MIVHVIVLSVKHDVGDAEDDIKAKEQAIMDLAHLYSKHGKAVEIAEMVKFTRPFLSCISKAKAAKLVKGLVDLFLDMNAETGLEVCVTNHPAK